MGRKSDRHELERRLQQASRLTAEAFDPITKERLQEVVFDLEKQLQGAASRE